MLRLFKVIKEIKLYREYLSTIKKESFDSPEWSKLRLRKDWFGRIFTVVNLPPEVTQSPDFPKYARPSFVFDKIKPINDYLTKMSLQELLAPLIDPIKGTDEESYLVVYYFVFRELSLLWIARFIIEVSALIWVFSYRTEILSWITGLVN
jgi:hypothetical protein